MKRVAPFSTDTLALSIQFLCDVLFRISELLITWSIVLRSALPPQMLIVLLMRLYVTQVLLLDTTELFSERTGEMAGAVPFSLCWLPLLLTLVVFPISSES